MKKITNGKIFALCLGDFARGLINGIITTYLLTFFIPTNSNTTLPQFFMKAALTMAIIRGIGTVIDAVTDPWVASLSDNSKAKSGRRISFMRWSAIPYGLFCLLIFFPPVAGSSVINAIWVGVMLALYYLFSTLYNIPYSALQAEVVAEPRKRVFLYSVVSLLYVVSSAMVFCTSMIKSILMKNGIEEIWALRIPFIVFCVLGGISALIPAFVIKEKDYVEPKEYHQSIWDALKATVSYPNFAIITVGYLIMWIAFTFFNTAEVYYITNLLNLGDEWVTYVSVISIGVGIMTYPLVNILARKVGKKPLLLGACITYVLRYFQLQPCYRRHRREAVRDTHRTRYSHAHSDNEHNPLVHLRGSRAVRLDKDRTEQSGYVLRRAQLCQQDVPGDSCYRVLAPARQGRRRHRRRNERGSAQHGACRYDFRRDFGRCLYLL